MIKRQLVATDSKGFHAGPCSHFAALASAFSSDIVVKHGSMVADGKSINNLITLDATGENITITLLVSGNDENCASEALCALIEEMLSGNQQDSQ